MMPNIKYRRRLLTIIELLLEGTPEARARAMRLRDRLYLTHRRHTINDVVWGGYVSELTDSVFFDDTDYPKATRKMLRHGSTEVHRAYLNYDFRPDFSDVEQVWLGNLLDLAAWLEP